MFEINAVPIYQDNYVWIISLDNRAWVVDPGDHQPVIKHLAARGLTLAGVLITHRHWDHITGVKALVEQMGSASTPIYGPVSEPIEHIVTHPLMEGDTFSIGPMSVDVWQIPGHTLDHIAYYLAEQHLIFCGDTLFACGCGRLFDGSMRQLFESLQRIGRLPAQTTVYCTHEYTLANIDFALAVEPDNAQLQQRQLRCQQLRTARRPTLPTSIEEELATNPFLRCDQPQIQEMVRKHTGASVQQNFSCFSALRTWKNRY